MYVLQTAVIILSLCSVPLAAQTPTTAASTGGKPPAAAVGEVSTDYFGKKVADPYRWMEAGTQDPKFLAFLKVQNDYTRGVLTSLSGRDQLLARIRELDNAVPTVRSWQRGGAASSILKPLPGRRRPR